MRLLEGISMVSIRVCLVPFAMPFFACGIWVCQGSFEGTVEGTFRGSCQGVLGFDTFCKGSCEKLD